MTFLLGLGHAGAHSLINTQKRTCSRQPGTYPQTLDQYPCWQHQGLSCSPGEWTLEGGQPQKVGSLASPCSQPQVCPAVLDQRKGFSHSQSPRPSEPSLLSDVLWGSHPAGRLGPRGCTPGVPTPGEAGSSPGQASLGFQLPAPEVKNIPSKSLESSVFKLWAGRGVGPSTLNILKFDNQNTLPLAIQRVL